MSTELSDRTSDSARQAPERVPVRRTRVFALAEARWSAIALVLFVAGLAAQFAAGPGWLFWMLYLACYVIGGWEPGWAGIKALRAKTLDVDLLMIVAAAGAAAIGQITDGALLIVIFATSGALEALATARTADSVRGLLDLAPDRATRIVEGGEQLVDTAELAVGDVILVRPGERIGADGTVVDGASEVDQATITGEPLPVEKTMDDQVFAGTVNGTGVLRVRAGRHASDSVVARIVAMVEQASATKAPTQLFIEKVEQRYSVGIVAATVAIFVIPLVLGDSLTASLLRAMTFMIVASPCAVVLSTMPPLLSAIANAGRHGVLVKSAVVMERLAATSVVALDKTGTLTAGTPFVAEVKPVAGSELRPEELLAIAAAAEHASEHPLARAVVAAASASGAESLEVSRFNAAPGRGVSARVAGYDVEVGSPTHLVGTLGSTWASVRRLVDTVEQGGHTAVLVVLDGQVAGVLALADRIRPDAADTVAALAELTGQAPILLTGDNARAASRLAVTVGGISDVRAGLLPAEKAKAIGELEAAGQRTLLVGDGINDAPALAAAHTGIAMGRAGSDLALQTADAIVVRDELAAIPTTIALARNAKRLVAQNLVLAAMVITGLVIWDLAGHLPLPLGVAGHEGSTVIVGLNGLRLLRNSAWIRARGILPTRAAPTTAKG